MSALKKNRHVFHRPAAAAVEFAMVAPILFLTIFACIEFGRVMMVESIVEQSAFEAARHTAVLGATKQEGIDIANQEMAVLGITDADIRVTPYKDGVAQSEIDQSTDKVAVSVSAKVHGAFVLAPFLNGGKVVREAVMHTERFEY